MRKVNTYYFHLIRKEGFDTKDVFVRCHNKKSAIDGMIANYPEYRVFLVDLVESSFEE